MILEQAEYSQFLNLISRLLLIRMPVPPLCAIARLSLTWKQSDNSSIILPSHLILCSCINKISILLNFKKLIKDNCFFLSFKPLMFNEAMKRCAKILERKLP